MKFISMLITFLQIGAATYLLVLAGTHIQKIWQEYRAKKSQK